MGSVYPYRGNCGGGDAEFAWVGGASGDGPAE